eukprot:GFKZ01005178.1.p1 GENE.GFKZ01005178.1~~GFKZ01005178.1.p1  ORF type:complete len:220 (-),score=32.03 GFKZ01005178.1:619-1278(-)
MAEVANPIPPSPIANSATRAAPAAPPSADLGTDSPSSSPFSLPRFITTPVEVFFASIGSFASSASSFVTSNGSRATSRARPWLEFIDLTAFSLPQDGFSATLDRVKINATYFMFNYLLLGLALTIFSVVTKPLALIGSLALVWIYFQFFGAAAEDEYRIFGFEFEDPEKIGILVFFGFLVFWFTAGGFAIFLSVCTATLFVTILHGIFRVPSPDAIPPV